MLVRFLRKVQNAIDLFRLGGARMFFRQLRRQIYSRHVQIGVEKNLEENDGQATVKSQIKYYLKVGTNKDMEEAFKKIRAEDRDSAEDLLTRRWLYQCGFGKWYVARTTDTNELCFIQSVIEPKDNSLLNDGFKDWFPELKRDEFLLEGAYAFKKFRGYRLCHAVASDLMDLYRQKGFRRMITYIKKDNIASIKASEKTGFKKFEEIPVTKILFFTIHHKKKKQS